MISLKVEEIIKSTKGELISGDEKYEISHITIDSRDVKQNSMFISIVGEIQDGHRYVESAYDNGCRAFLVSSLDFINEKILNDSSVIKVENTELALGKISKYYIDLFDLDVIGVTGSVGKTTTRDMIFSVISNKFNAVKNQKNFNNQFGVPLTIFNIEKKHECAVIEMGMCGFGEIDYLAEITRPKIAVISNIGLSHVENLGSQEGILKAKMEIANYFDENSILIINGDDAFLSKVASEYRDNGEKFRYKILTFGKFPTNTIYTKKIEVLGNNKTKFTVKIDNYDESIDFEIPTVGEHNVFNAMSAILAGLSMNMSIDEIKEGLLKFVPTENRQDVIDTEKYTIINDVYNASPDSMIASLRVLSLFDKNRRVAILGDCLEMGDFSEEGHRRIGHQAIGKTDVLISIGDVSKYIAIEAKERGFDLSNVYHFNNKEEFFNELNSIIKDGDVILVKASRGMKFEDIVEILKGGK